MHASLCDYIADLTQNAQEAGATQIDVELRVEAGRVELKVKDNGKGMDATRLAQARDPFYSEPGKHDHRRVGLGLPLLCQAAEGADGAVEIESRLGRGTTVTFSYDPTHLDAPPLGNLAETFAGLMVLPGDYNLTLHRTAAHGGSYSLARHELTEALGDLAEAGNIVLMRQYIASQEDSLKEET